jgi:hypothetical protein
MSVLVVADSIRSGKRLAGPAGLPGAGRLLILALSPHCWDQDRVSPRHAGTTLTARDKATILRPAPHAANKLSGETSQAQAKPTSVAKVNPPHLHISHLPDPFPRSTCWTRDCPTGRDPCHRSPEPGCRPRWSSRALHERDCNAGHAGMLAWHGVGEC